MILEHKYCNLTEKVLSGIHLLWGTFIFLGLKKGTDQLCFWKEKTFPQSEWFYFAKLGHSLVFRAWSLTALPRLGGTWPAPSSPLSQEARLHVGASACMVLQLTLLTDFRCWWAGGGGERAGQEEAAVFPALEKNREVFHIWPKLANIF